MNRLYRANWVNLPVSGTGFDRKNKRGAMADKCNDLYNKGSGSVRPPAASQMMEASSG